MHDMFLFMRCCACYQRLDLCSSALASSA